MRSREIKKLEQKTESTELWHFTNGKVLLSLLCRNHPVEREVLWGWLEQARMGTTQDTSQGLKHRHLFLGWHFIPTGREESTCLQVLIGGRTVRKIRAHNRFWLFPFCLFPSHIWPQSLLFTIFKLKIIFSHPIYYDHGFLSSNFSQILLTYPPKSTPFFPSD